MNEIFLKALEKNDWIEVANDWTYKKGNYIIQQDTSSWWMIINNSSNSRVFDFPEPTDYTAPWTVNLIEYLCKLDLKLSH